MSWLARGLALPTRRLFLHHGNSGPIHLHIQDGHRLADDDGQIQLQGFLDLSLLALGDIGSDGLCRTLHGFGGHLQAGQKLHLLAAVIERGLLAHQTLHAAQPARPTLRPPDPSARPYGVVQRHGRAVGLLPAPPPDGPQQPFFFLLGPAAPLRLDRAESTDLVVEGDQVLAKLLEAMKLGDLLLRLAQRRGIGKALRYRLAGDAASEAKLRIMSRVVVFGAVAGRFAAAPGHGGNGTRSKITQVEELLQELGSLGFQSCEIVRHRGLLSVSYLICTYRYVQNNATKKGNPQDASSRSRTPHTCPH